MFDADVTTCGALFLTNLIHLKPFDKKPSLKIASLKKALFCYSEKRSVTSENIRYFFTVENTNFTHIWYALNSLLVYMNYDETT